MAENMLELAGCILLDRQGRILLLHRNTDKYNHWEIPGGKIEPGEDPAAAAGREIKEELGLKVKIGRRVGEASFVDGQPMHSYWFLAMAEGEPRVAEPDKFDGLAYFSINELENGQLSLSEGAKCFTRQVKSGKVTI